MKKQVLIALVTAGMALVIPGGARGQEVQGAGSAPPIAQPVIREGELAVKLAEALHLGTTADEAEAETLLGNAAIAPRNGWIADYPVTPDIIGEVRQSVSDAADGQRLTMEKDEALRAFQDVTGGMGLVVTRDTPGQTSQEGPAFDNPPPQTVINNYYVTEGPPIVTYYPPPPDYLYLYSWVPHPFWWGAVWCPGFYILLDFHRVFVFHNRVEVISNHFVYPPANRVFRIDPVERFSGRTFGGIGAPRRYHWMTPSGVRGGPRAVFGPYRDRVMTGGRRTVAPPSHGGKRGGPGRDRR